MGYRPEVKTTMRQNHDKARKAAARRRAAATGERYTIALRKVTEDPTSISEPPVEVWVDAWTVLAGFDVEGGQEINELDERIMELHDSVGPDAEGLQALEDDRWAVEFLKELDEDAYQDALTAAVLQVAAERGITVEVLRPTFGQTNEDGSVAAAVLVAAVERTVLPQLGKAPREVTDGTIRAAVTAAGRTYTARIRTDERPDVAAELAQLNAEMDAAELPPGTPVVPLDTIAAGDVVTLQPLEEDGSISMEPITDLVHRADEHSIVIGFFGKMVRYNGRLMLDSTGDMFDVVDIARDALARVEAAAAARAAAREDR